MVDKMRILHDCDYLMEYEAFLFALIGILIWFDNFGISQALSINKWDNGFMGAYKRL